MGKSSTSNVNHTTNWQFVYFSRKVQKLSQSGYKKSKEPRIKGRSCIAMDSPEKRIFEEKGIKNNAKFC